MKIELFSNNKAFSLLEVLVSITLLNIIVFSLLTFFLNSYQFTFSNQDNTVGVNVAKNVVTYIENQDFQHVRDYFSQQGSSELELTIDSCSTVINGSLLFDQEEICRSNFSPVINNQTYSVLVTLTEFEGSNEQETEEMKSELIPIEASVQWERKRMEEVLVRGVLRNE
ncbi:prepilin-type N-terminal cleavage/methylation domain-containing protein [Jeotgalibacillus sp. ET6]|uniref:type IV pilus modification PilV family protein n=1 Tax=Jeotgalibacillus sp. ET6 TaxID=3037260 RepID=UPI0024186368|nr:prepilin-type N-terminal cleavage/methylation domain-containing protein [Jeotgalibacillus sp. ET6]MDG5470965.1 prepilin-type N-terminal cleavage/methylation domain-containing protein [Jeotgalibacillus sp. ET6]